MEETITLPQDLLDSADWLTEAQDRRARRLLSAWDNWQYEALAPSTVAASAVYWANSPNPEITQQTVADAFDVSVGAIKDHRESVCRAVGADTPKAVFLAVHSDE